MAQQFLHKEEIPINKSNPTSKNSQDDWDSILNNIDALCAPESPAPKEKPAGSKRSRKKRRSRLLAIPISITVIALMALVGLIPLLSEATTVIPQGVSAGGISLGALSRKEAAAALEILCRQDLVLLLPQGELTLTPEETGISLDTEALLDAAEQAVAPTELALQPYLSLDSDSIRSAIADSLG